MEPGSTAALTAGAQTRNPAEANPSAFREAMETFEQGVRDTLRDANTAVHDALDKVSHTAEAAEATMGKASDAVGGAVQGGVASLARAFDLRRQVRRHPFLLLGAAVFVGYVAGNLIFRARRESA